MMFRYSDVPLGVALLVLILAGTADAASARREPGGAIHFYDDRGNDRGFAWCAKQGGFDSFGSSVCNYFSYEQCRAALVNPPGGDCQPNPFASQVTLPPPQRRR